MKVKWILIIIVILSLVVSCEREPVNMDDIMSYEHNTSNKHISFIYPQDENEIKIEEDIEELKMQFGLNQLESSKLFIDKELKLVSIIMKLEEGALLSQIQSIRGFVLKKFVLKSEGKIGVEPYDLWLRENYEEYNNVEIFIEISEDIVLYEKYENKKIEKFENILTAEFNSYNEESTIKLEKFLRKNGIKNNISMHKSILGYSIVIKLDGKMLPLGKIQKLEEYIVSDEFSDVIIKEKETYDSKLIVIQLENDENLYYESAYDMGKKIWLDDDWMNYIIQE